MNYEIQIIAKDRTKIIRFPENDATHMAQLMAWEEYYYAMGSVIDDKADKFRENNTIIGRIDVRDIPFEDVVDMMCEDLNGYLVKILTEEQEVSVVEMELA